MAVNSSLYNTKFIVFKTQFIIQNTDRTADGIGREQRDHIEADLNHFQYKSIFLNTKSIVLN